MDFLREDLLMKQSVFETEIFSRSLSLKNAGVRISCDRLALPKIEWLLPSGELLWASDDADSFRRLHFLSLRSHKRIFLCCIFATLDFTITFPQLFVKKKLHFCTL